MAARLLRNLGRQLLDSKETATIEEALWEMKWLISKLSTSKTSTLDDTYHTLPLLQPSLRLANKSRFSLLSQTLDVLSPASHQKLSVWVYQRARLHKPLQYILGTQPFAELDIKLRRPTLIPRWETEEWSIRVVDTIRNKHLTKTSSLEPLNIIDMCSGTGCISLTLARHLGTQTRGSAFTKNPCRVLGLDVDKRAIQLSQINARRNGIGWDRVSFQQIDLMGKDVSPSGILQLFETSFPSSHPLKGGGIDYIVSNPPYIPHHEYVELDQSVKDWEDQKALLGAGADGLGFYDVIARLAIKLLKRCVPTGAEARERVFLEIGGNQAYPVQDILMQAWICRN
ncbi:S-adenosyl-L-methionine-dependent methyltransferase [Obelidium mucronatum]|nr:S-adenosyl-L-methionine-dependent methyltransferase [Obelidium mucronatum]